MASTILRRLFISVGAAKYRWCAAASQLYFSNVLGNIERPFDIDFAVDIRSPLQVSLKKNVVIKTNTILNGRSSLRQFGLDFGPDTYIKEFCYLDSYGGFIEISDRKSVV